MGSTKNRHRPAELTGPEAEVARLRAVFWEILRASGAELPRRMPAPGEHDPDVPEWALARVGELRDEMEEYTGVQGADIQRDAGPDDVCTCGEVITWYRGTWMHLFNPSLRRYTSHTARPATGFYNPAERAARQEAGQNQIRLHMDDDPDAAQLRAAVDQIAARAQSWATGGNVTTTTGVVMPSMEVRRRADGRLEYTETFFAHDDDTEGER